jgi:hypothetical protein
MIRRKRTLMLPLFALLGFILTAGAADPVSAAPTITVSLYEQSFSGEGWTTSVGLTAELILADATGAVKGEWRGKIDATGYWQGYLSLNGAWIRPGDSLQVKVDGADQGTLTVPSLSLKSISPATDVITGRVLPAGAPGTKELYLRDLLFATSGQVEREMTVPVTTDATGRFRANLAGQYNVLRMTGVRLRYLSGIFVITTYAVVPGFGVEIGANSTTVDTLKYGAYTAALFAPTGMAKAVRRFDFGKGQDPPEAEFFNPRGPVPILPGDRIVVTGPSSMSLKVPPADCAIDSAANSVSGRITPDTTVEVLVSIIGPSGSTVTRRAYPTSDAEGNFGVSFGPSDLKLYDRVELWFRDPQGNFYKVRKQVTTP